jgi:hypothetical protein
MAKPNAKLARSSNWRTAFLSGSRQSRLLARGSIESDVIHAELAPAKNQKSGGSLLANPGTSRHVFPQVNNAG